MTKTGIVINALGECVLVDSGLVVVLSIDDVVSDYNLKEKETIIYQDIEIAFSMLKPKYDLQGKLWIETATPEEIENAKGTPMPPSLNEETAILYGAMDEMFNMLVDTMETNAVLMMKVEALEAEKEAKQ